MNLIDKLQVFVSFDEKHGYVGRVPGLRQPIIALSLGGLRRRIEAMLMPDEVDLVLQLDRAARVERDRRRKGGEERSTDYRRGRL